MVSPQAPCFPRQHTILVLVFQYYVKANPRSDEGQWVGMGIRLRSRLRQHIPPSLCHFVTQGLLPSVAVLGCGFSLPVCGFVRTFGWSRVRICCASMVTSWLIYDIATTNIVWCME